jgi:hypothetical protein
MRGANGIASFRRATAEKVLKMAFDGRRREVFSPPQAAAVDAIPMQFKDLTAEGFGRVLPGKNAWQALTKVPVAVATPPFVASQFDPNMPATPAFMPHHSPISVFQSKPLAITFRAGNPTLVASLDADLFSVPCNSGNLIVRQSENDF